MKYINIKLLLIVLITMCAAPVSVAQSTGGDAKVKQGSTGMILQMSQPAPQTLDSMSIQVMDSATATRFWLQFQSARQKGKIQSIPDRSFNHLAYIQELMEKQQKVTVVEQPVRVRTESGKGSQIMVYIENTSPQSFKDMKVKLDMLPTGWKSTHSEQHIEKISSGQETKLIFDLSGDALTEEIIGLSLHIGEGWNMGWTARVSLPEEGKQKEMPQTFQLHGNYPNPFNPTTTISYSLPETMTVKIQIYNLQGQRVADLGKKSQQAGLHNVTWDAGALASGTYFYQLVATGTNGKEFVKQQTMLLIK